MTFSPGANNEIEVEKIKDVETMEKNDGIEAPSHTQLAIEKCVTTIKSAEAQIDKNEVLKTI